LKKLLSISFVIIYLFGATEASQLVKLPKLMQHYLHHQQENPAISLLTFLKMHYAEKFVMDDDYQQDMELPFKTPENCGFMAINSILPEPIQIESKLVEMPALVFIITQDTFPQSFSPDDFFQPPRMA
jgi:hypothetical protein